VILHITPLIPFVPSLAKTYPIINIKILQNTTLTWKRILTILASKQANDTLLVEPVLADILPAWLDHQYHISHNFRYIYDTDTVVPSCITNPYYSPEHEAQPLSQDRYLLLSKEVLPIFKLTCFYNHIKHIIRRVIIQASTLPAIPQTLYTELSLLSNWPSSDICFYWHRSSCWSIPIKLQMSYSETEYT
jgi:hypothetical protein